MVGERQKTDVKNQNYWDGGKAAPAQLGWSAYGVPSVELK
jgi:hypothetical protein